MDVKNNFFMFQFTTQFLLSPKQEKHFRETSSYHHTTAGLAFLTGSASRNLHASTYTSIHVIQVIINLETGIEIFSSLPTINPGVQETHLIRCSESTKYCSWRFVITVPKLAYKMGQKCHMDKLVRYQLRTIPEKNHHLKNTTNSQQRPSKIFFGGKKSIFFKQL